MIGEIVGTYRVIAEVGSGGMGAVWLGEHTLLGSRAAIKVLKSEFSQQKAIVDRFFDEARAATRIVDPGIVTVFDFGWHHDRSAYLVMELLSGETLARRIKRVGPLPAATALNLLRMCATTMAAAHERGIVHRDLKPDNIFVVPDLATGERVKILDFGIAKLLGDGAASHEKTQTGLILGTPGYMSPEQCRGAGAVDHRTDIYALGCVLFHMLCGRPPFVASTPGDLIACHLTLPPPAPSTLVTGIGERLDALVLDCLVKPADKRIQTMTDLVARIDEVVTSGSIQTAFVAPRARPSEIDEETPPATLRPSAASVAAQIAPRPSGPAIRPTAERLAAPETLAPTTASSLSGELRAVRPRRTGAILLVFGALAAASIAVIVIASRKPDERQAPSPPPAAASDGAPAPVENAEAIETVHEAHALREMVPVAPLVVEQQPPPVVKKPPVVQRPPDRGSAKPPVTPGNGSAKPPVTPGSGSAKPPVTPGSAAPAGSGSADPYRDR